MRRLLAETVVVAFAIVPMQSQTAQKPSFEVVSIKPAAEIPPYGLTFLPGRVTAHGPVNGLISPAYQLPPRQIEGNSPVLTENYDTDARASTTSIPPEATIQERNHQLRLMLQTLLAERFGLRVHMETRDLPVYA